MTNTMGFFSFMLLKLSLINVISVKYQFADKDFCEFNNMQCITKPEYDEKCVILSTAISELCAIPSKLIHFTRERLRDIHEKVENGFLCYTYNDNGEQKVFDKWCSSFVNGECIHYAEFNDYLCDYDHTIYSINIKDDKRDLMVYKYPVRDILYENDLLIAIDGTGSKSEFEKEETNPEKNPLYHAKYMSSWKGKEWRWKSHIANFAEDYLGLSLYWYGPEANEMISAGSEVDNIVGSAYNKTCQFIKNKAKYNIDIIGYSRGGYAATQLASRLENADCVSNKVNVRFLGLYDPVKRTYEGSELRDIFNKYTGINIMSVKNKNIITSNVNNVMIVKRDANTWSRTGFGYLITDSKDIKNKNACPDNKCIQIITGTSHGGIGGGPGSGDCKDECGIFELFCYRCFGYTENKDKKGSVKADILIRTNAYNVGVPIEITTRDYYANVSSTDKYSSLFVDYEIVAKQEL